MAKVKGAAVQDFFVWHAREYGEEQSRLVWSRLPAECQSIVGASREQLLPFHWYPAESIHALLDSALSGRSEAERERMAREGAHAVIGQTLRGLYKAIFVTLVSPKRYLKSVNVVWKAFHDTGRITGQEVSAGHHRTELAGWEAHHDFIERLNGHAAADIYRALGCEGVEIEQSRQGREGDRIYATDIRWKA